MRFFPEAEEQLRKSRSLFILANIEIELRNKTSLSCQPNYNIHFLLTFDLNKIN